MSPWPQKRSWFTQSRNLGRDRRRANSLDPRAMAELILTGAELRHGSSAQPLGEALAVGAGRILALGSAAQVLRHKAPGTRVIRLRGGCLLPGFVDPHLHFRALARRRHSLDCAGAGDGRALSAMLRQAASRGGSGWLFAHGLEHRRAGFGPLPALEALDRATAGRPLWLRHRSGHISLLNSAALRELGCLERDPPEGRLERSGGRSTGLAYEAEGWIAARLRERQPPPSPEDVAETARSLLRQGVTAFADLTAGNAAADLVWWRAEHLAGRIPQAVSLWVAPETLLGRPHPGRQEAVRLGGIKVLLRQHQGGFQPEAEALAEILARAARGGWPVAVHAVEGDALAHVLEALRLARQRSPCRVPRLRLEHLNLVPPALLEALEEVEAAVCAQPGLLWALGDLFRETLPREHWRWLFPLASLRRHATALAIGSDAPAAPESPLRHVSAAWTRRDRAGGAWGRAERIGIGTALRAVTEAAARLAGFAREAGALHLGWRADALWFAESWGELRRLLEQGTPPAPSATLAGGVWHRWR